MLVEAKCIDGASVATQDKQQRPGNCVIPAILRILLVSPSLMWADKMMMDFSWEHTATWVAVFPDLLSFSVKSLIISVQEVTPYYSTFYC